jgi:pimeloyl-ACP methyl ester carboxylesterase
MAPALFRRLAFAATLTASLHAASVYGAKLHWSSAGNDHSKTVIFVHGWTCDETTWQEQVPALSKSYRVITLDLPGHGRSGAPGDGKLTVDLFVRAIDAVRAEAKVDRAVFVGHSMGAPVVRQYARLFPAHTAALVFVDGVIVKPDQIQRFWSNGTNSEGPNGPKFREQLIRSMFSASTTPAEQKHILSMMLSAPESTASSAAKSLADPSLWKENPMNLPVLGLYADHGGRGDRQYLATLFPSLEYHEIPGTGHFLMLEKPAEFNSLLLQFLEKQRY